MYDSKPTRSSIRENPSGSFPLHTPLHMPRAPLLLLCVCLLIPARAAGPRPSHEPTPATPERLRQTVQSFAAAHGFSRVAETEREIRLSGNVHTLVLEKNARRATLNNVQIWLSQPVVQVRRNWTLDADDVQNTLLPVIRPAPGLAGLRASIVVLDPGHGGSDPGAISPAGLREKDVVLDISLRARRHLQAAGHTVLLTRHQDQTLSLQERTRRARAWNADVFVSVHANQAANTAAQGIETFVLSLPGHPSTSQPADSTAPQLSREGNRHNAANMTLGYALQTALLSATGATDRGVRRARFTVLVDSPAPAALVEAGFLSNPAEAARLADPAHRELLARAIAHGIDNYLREVRRATLTAPPPAAQRR